MFSISEKDKDVIIKYMAYAATYVESEENLMVAAAKLFSDSFEEASDDDGLEVAERLLNTVVYFKDQANEHLCRTGSAAETLDLCLSKFENDKEKIKVLRLVVDSLKNSGLFLAQTECDEEDVLNEGCDELSDELLGIVNNISKNFDYDYISKVYAECKKNFVLSEDDCQNKVLYSMAFYCAAKKDELSSVPNSIVPEQCAAAVCAACEINAFFTETVDDSLELEVPGAYYQPKAKEMREDFIAQIFILFVFLIVFIMETIVVIGLISSPETFIIAVVAAIVFAFIDIVVCIKLLEELPVLNTLLDMLLTFNPALAEMATENTAITAYTDNLHLKAASVDILEVDEDEDEDEEDNHYE